MHLNCPACGAEVHFKSKSTISSVCTFCKSLLVRHDINLKNLGKVADLPDDMSPLQIGTQGKFEGQQFQIIGRFKIEWKEGRWNEWIVLFEDQRIGWLGEAQGFFMMSFPATVVNPLPAPENIRVGDQLALIEDRPHQIFHVEDIKTTTCIGIEGELPFSAKTGRQSLSIDLNGPQKAFATLERSQEDGIKLFIGRYVDFDDLNLTHLRTLEGW